MSQEKVKQAIKNEVKVEMKQQKEQPIMVITK